MKAQGPLLKLYYDGACHLCSREIDTYLKKDEKGILQAVDISSSDFKPELEGLDPQRVHKFFHVKTCDGQVFEGVEAFAAIWDLLGILRPLSWFSKTFVGGFAMRLSYVFFAEVRPYLPKRKNCESCKI